MPPTIKLRARLIKVNPTRFNKILFDEASRIFGEAALEFIRETAKHVAVDTGMSLASLRAAGDSLGVGDSGISITPKRGPRPGFVPPELPYVKGSTDMSRYKSIKEGIAAGKDAAKIIAGSPSKPVFRFEFTIKVFQYLYWEAIWQSTLYGQEAFERTLVEGSRQLFDRIAPVAFDFVRIE